FQCAHAQLAVCWRTATTQLSFNLRCSDRLLSLRFRLLTKSDDTPSATANGHGFWKAQPRIGQDSEFQAKLNFHLSATIRELNSTLPAWHKWERIKLVAAKTVRAHSRRQAFSVARAESLLQRKWAKIESNLMNNLSLHPCLPPQLHIQYHVETLSLKAGIRWREQRELSAGYLKRTASARLTKTTIPPRFHPTFDRVCVFKDEMLDAAFVFYDNLLAPNPIGLNAKDSLLEAIPQSYVLFADDSSLLTDSISFDGIMEAFSRCPKQSSPGLDDLPYSIVQLIVLHPLCKNIVVQMYNDALKLGIFPPFWLSTSVCLLPKKGDLFDLRNWRPISLINSDAKVFTRILNSRFLMVTDQMINPYQTGFVRGRFIADSRLSMKLLIEHARTSNSPAIALLLDQEKAYYQVHPLYRQLVLEKFGFPSA
ncbi:hypothetical protein A0J61_11183, partial [Choanephora cucurbitarum]